MLSLEQISNSISPQPLGGEVEGKEKMAIPAIPSITGGASSAESASASSFGAVSQVNTGGTLQTIATVFIIGGILWFTRRK